MLLALVQAASSGENTDISGQLIVFHAGSLAVPFKQIAQSFEQAYPSVRVQLEAAGSRDCARKITELGRPCDVMAASDYAVIDTLLIPNHAAWNIKFAGNEMAIVYDEKSRHAAEITAENWPGILLRDDVAFGRADPNADPCGYRTVLALKLAERYYGQPGLAEKLADKDNRYIRPKETDLLALLETRTIDYIFLYRSVAEQHGLKWLALSDAINLKKPELADEYKKASVEISGTTPGSKITQKGEPMVYGITIPKNSPNPAAALAFVEFLLDKDKGLAIMAKNGQPSVVPAPSETYGQLPEPLRKFAVKQ